MRAHGPYKDMLTAAPGMYFAESLAILEKDCRSKERIRMPNRVSVHSFEEVPCIFSEQGFGERDRSHSPQMDALLDIALSRGTIYYRDSILVGIEIKTSAHDLRSDKKFTKYLGHSDFMYLAVTPELVEKALQKVADIDEYGVLDITTGHIHKRARRQSLSLEERYAMKTILLDYSLYGNYTSNTALIGDYLLRGLEQTDDTVDYRDYCVLLYNRRNLLDDIVASLDYYDQLEGLYVNSRYLQVCYYEFFPEEEYVDMEGFEYEYK